LHRNLAVQRVHVGAIGEQVVANALERRGYLIQGWHERGDLTVLTPDGEYLYVEIKTARKGKDGKWRFTLRKKGSQDHSKSDIVILLCVMKAGDAVPFVIPTEQLLSQNQAVITSYPHLYQGKFTAFKQSLKYIKLKTQ
jgi:hypothetical protein